jgi:hypothetical protein
MAPPLLTSALDGGEWSASRPGRFIHRDRAPVVHWIEVSLGPIAGLGFKEKRKVLTPPIFKRPACSALLYRLSYPGTHFVTSWVSVQIPTSLVPSSEAFLNG